MNSILALLVIQHSQGKWTAEPIFDDDETDLIIDWGVFDDDGYVVYTENTEHEAQIIAAVCNLVGKDDWQSIESYVMELCPDSFGANSKPAGER